MIRSFLGLDVHNAHRTAVHCCPHVAPGLYGSLGGKHASVAPTAFVHTATPQQAGFEAGGDDHRHNTSFIRWDSSAVKLRRLVYSSSVRPIFSNTESVNTFFRNLLLRVLLRMLYPKRQHNHFLVKMSGVM